MKYIKKVINLKLDVLTRSMVQETSKTEGGVIPNLPILFNVQFASVSRKKWLINESTKISKKL